MILLKFEYLLVKELLFDYWMMSYCLIFLVGWLYNNFVIDKYLFKIIWLLFILIDENSLKYGVICFVVMDWLIIGRCLI